MRLIDADALKEKFKVRHWIVGRDSDPDCLLDDAPTVDAEPIRHGEWVCIEFDGYADGNVVPITLECSLCNHIVDAENESRYCPNCGAKMDGERKDDE